LDGACAAGTKLTVRGTGFGKDKSDVQRVTVCGVDCDLGELKFADGKLKVSAHTV
jgi:hypothetical protein